MNKLSRYYQLLSLILLISQVGCASNSGVIPVTKEQLFNDQHFSKPIDFASADEVFLLTPDQRRWLDTTIVTKQNRRVTQQVIDKVLKRDYRLFDYDNSYTRTAAQTLEMGQGNCLSMVIMTAAIAKHFGIDFYVQEILSAPVWDRGGGLYLLNGHVNIKLKRTLDEPNANTFTLLTSSYITLDFLNSAQRRHLSKRTISEDELIALYYMNLAADAMVISQWDRAYWLLRAAIEHAPNNSSAWNTLGVLYKRNNLLDLAEGAYKQAMALNGSDMNVVTNYALLLEMQGRYQELFNYQRQVDLAQLNNPYRYFDMADFAYADRDYERAAALYKKAIKLSPVVDDFHFGLYRTYLAMGRRKDAVKELRTAHKHSADYQDRQRYNVKIALLTME